MFWLVVSGDTRWLRLGIGIALCALVECETAALVLEDQEAETLGWNQK